MYDCVFYRREVIFIVYVYDGIFSSPSDTATDQAITEIWLKFNIEDQVTLDNYIGVNIETPHDGKINIFKPHIKY